MALSLGGWLGGVEYVRADPHVKDGPMTERPWAVPTSQGCRTEHGNIHVHPFQCCLAPGT